MSEPISVRARFERFPATVKGAFIVRGEDPDPHQVALHRARAVPVGAGASAEVPVAPVILDVVPHRDVFVPFELPVSELEPGWYSLVCDVEVDGTAASYDGGRRFSVPWPRATVRRGTVKIGRTTNLGKVKVRLEQLDLGGDSARLALVVEPAGPIEVKLSADGRRLEVLDAEFDEVTGRGRVSSYPVLRTASRVRIDLKRRGSRASVDVRLD